MKIVFEPISSYENQYVRIFVDLIKANKLEAYGLNYALMRPWLLMRIKVVHLNWFENLDAENKYELVVTFAKRLVQWTILRLFRKKIIWTMHNRFPHQPEGKYFKKKILSNLIKRSSRIVIHSKSSKNFLLESYDISEEKIYYIPHPNYIGDYQIRQDLNPVKPASGKLRLLFVGAVKPYKNVELLIDVLKEVNDCTLHLTIAGKAKDEEYRQYIVEYARGLPSVDLKLNFIPDSEIANLIREADLIVLPYDLKSSLNSGTAILSFSCARTVICPEIGTVSDLKHKDKMISYSYSLHDDSDHFKQLSTAVAMACRLFKQNKMIFEEWGQIMFEEMKEYNSKQKCGKLLISLYKEFEQ